MNSPRQSGWLLVNFAATIFVSAFLLFQVQPLISRYILPWFGGSPAVWTTCMLFFQTVLFAGYAYAHAINRLALPRWQGIAHLALLAGALCLAHIEPSASWKPVDSSLPTWRILLLLAACVGAPYFVLSTTGPLLQAWFSHHYPGRSPYRLYALSNLGSLIALLSYPFFFEPTFDLHVQVWMWFCGYAVFVVLCGLLAARLGRSHGPMSEGDTPSLPSDVQAAAGLEVNLTPQFGSEVTMATLVEPHVEHSDPLPNWWRRVLWLLLPAFGSFMFLATTNHVCTDVAVIPFLWVAPLSVYLLSLIVAFDHPRWYLRAVYALGAIVTLYLVAMVYDDGLGRINLYDMGFLGTTLRAFGDTYGPFFTKHGTAPLQFPIQVGFVLGLCLHFASLFFVCMLCHGELVRLRPPSRYLTSYYLMISAGGAVGGLFVSLIAPRIFVTFFEWKMGMVGGYILAACLLLHQLALWVVRSVIVPIMNSRFRWDSLMAPFLSVVLILVVGSGLYDVINYLAPGSNVPLYASRNFYGTVSVWERAEGNPERHRLVLKNGSIIHGVQFVAQDKRRQPTTYYSRQSGVGRAIEFLGATHDKMRVGTVGLGAGTIAAYGRAGDTYRFYEINPAVIDLAKDPKYFTFLSGCPGKVTVVDGDARLSLDREQPQHYHVLALDAFSGDAIPTHLLTHEAFEIYRRQIATKDKDSVDGVIAIHISNKYLNLRPVVRAGAAQLGMSCIEIENEDDSTKAVNHARWMLLTKNDSLIQAVKPYETSLKPKEQELELRMEKNFVPWTDAHSDLYHILIR